MKRRLIRGSVVLVPLLLSFASFADPASGQGEPFQVSLLGPGLQLHPPETDITGFRLNLIYGKNRDVTGLDVGLLNHVTGDMRGLQHGVVGNVRGDVAGWQNNLVNLVEGELRGVQTGLVNGGEDGAGAQLGLVNYAGELRGFQGVFALVNYAEELEGVQIGLVNIIRSKEVLPVLPFVNWNFREE